MRALLFHPAGTRPRVCPLSNLYLSRSGAADINTQREVFFLKRRLLSFHPSTTLRVTMRYKVSASS